MSQFRRRLLAVAAASLSGVVPLAAQVDYRNLDGHRPTRVTDAYPVERFAFEFSVPYTFARASGVSTHSVAPHLEYGIARNAMVGLGVRVGSHSEVAEASLGGLWNVRRETAGWPALSLSGEASQPFDGRFGADASLVVGLLATRSVGRSRVHVNGAVSLNGSGPNSIEGPPDWWAGVAWDRTLFRSSTVVIGELIVEDEGSANSVRWLAGIGARRQITPTVVLHGGIERALTGRGSATEVSLGLSRAFAVASLFPGGRR